MQGELFQCHHQRYFIQWQLLNLFSFYNIIYLPSSNRWDFFLLFSKYHTIYYYNIFQEREIWKKEKYGNPFKDLRIIMK